MSGTFFYLHHPEDEAAGIAQAPDGVEHSIIQEGKSAAPKWKPIKFTVKGAPLTDYLPNDLGLPMVSPKLRGVLEEHAGADAIEFLPVTVSGQPYFIVNFPKRPDVLNAAKTVATGAVVIKAVIDGKKVANHHVFNFKGGGKVRVIVSDRVRNAIEAAKCTHIEFGKVPVA